MSGERDETQLSLADLQDRVDEQIQAFGGYWDPFQILARLTEELGEVAAALQRSKGLRPHKTSVDLEAEVGDLLFTVMAFANVHQINLQAVLQRAMAKYEARDKQAWQTRRSIPKDSS